MVASRPPCSFAACVPMCGLFSLSGKRAGVWHLETEGELLHRHHGLQPHVLLQASFMGKHKQLQRSSGKGSVWVGVWKKGRIFILWHEFWRAQPLEFTCLYGSKHEFFPETCVLAACYMVMNLCLGRVLTNVIFNNIHFQFYNESAPWASTKLWCCRFKIFPQYWDYGFNGL